MENLKKYAPAQVLALTKKSTPAFNEFLKLTMMDLVFKKVIKFETVEEGEQEKKEVKYVSTGESSDSYVPHPFEEVLLNPFKEDSELRLLFDQYVKVVLQNAGSYKDYLFVSVIEKMEMTSFFKQGFWQKLLVSIKRTPEGVDEQKRIQIELDDLKDKLPSLIQTDPDAAKKLIQAIGANVFLVEGFDAEELKKLNFELPGSRGDATSDDTWFYMFMFSDFGTSFDSHAHGFDGDADGGGDSGCSGCSGCGGCGS